MTITKLQIAFAVAALLVMTGCVTPATHSSHRKPIETYSITNFTAYCASNTVEIGYWLRDRSVLAHAAWTPTEGGSADYQCRFSVLTFDRQRRATRKLVVSPKNRLMIRDAAQWKELLQAVFTGLAPHKPGHGVLLMAQEMEIVVFRNAAGELKVVNLADKPSGLIVDHTYSDADFSREAIKLLTASVSAMDPNRNQFLFVTGDEPDFVLVDLRTHLVIFLSYPGDPDEKPMAVSGLFALRVANSLLIKSLLITAVKNPFSLVGSGLWHLGSSGVTLLNSISMNKNDPPPPPLYTGPGMDLTNWEKELDRKVTARRHQGHIQMFVDGNQFFPELIQSIETATQRVDVLVYIFGTDDYAVKIADVLKQRSDSVRVRVLMDDIG
ncbi:MAG TPA: hypothetical protein VGJ73_10830 [Verrucomicrobiae bacterium]